MWILHLQAHTWCDDGAYLLANQLVDKYQSKEGAQAALREIERFLEGAPSILSSGPDILAIEYETVITPQLQVSHHSNHFRYLDHHHLSNKSSNILALSENMSLFIKRIVKYTP